MEERKLNINRNDDPSLVDDKDGQLLIKLEKIYNNLKLNLGSCYDQLKEGKLTEGMKETHLSLTEHYVIDFLKAMNYDSVLERQINERHNEIRSLNQENRELRKQLGEKVTNEDLREKLKNISNEFRAWWNIYGFGHVSKIHYTEYGYLEVVLSGMITDSYYDKSKDTTKKDKIKYLSDIGFETYDDDVIMNDESIDLLNRLITSRYPSAEISEIKSFCRKNKRILREIEVYIYNLNDL